MFAFPISRAAEDIVSIRRTLLAALFALTSLAPGHTSAQTVEDDNDEIIIVEKASNGSIEVTNIAIGQDDISDGGNGGGEAEVEDVVIAGINDSMLGAGAINILEISRSWAFTMYSGCTYTDVVDVQTTKQQARITNHNALVIVTVQEAPSRGLLTVGNYAGTQCLRGSTVDEDVATRWAELYGTSPHIDRVVHLVVVGDKIRLMPKPIAR